MPKINGNEIKPGNVLEHDKGLWAAIKVEHVKPGKGGAFAQVELKNLRTGSKLNERFRSADKVERVRLEQKDQQFLYESDGILVFMDVQSFEQVERSRFECFERGPSWGCKPWRCSPKPIDSRRIGTNPMNRTRSVTARRRWRRIWITNPSFAAPRRTGRRLFIRATDF